MRPGTEISKRDTAPARSAPTDTGVLFAIGNTTTQPVTQPVEIRSIAEYEASFGERGGAGIALYDAIDVYLREGGSRVYVVGLDGPGEDSVIDPDQLDDALALLTAELGPGQLVCPEANTSAEHAVLIAHVEATNRIAVLDAPSDADATDLATLAAANQNTQGSHRAALFAPYAVVPGLAPSTTRTVAYSAVAAAHMARIDAVGNPNIPAAGENGKARYAVSLSASFTDTEREELNDAGVNLAKVVYGSVRTYGFRTITSDIDWQLLNNARLLMDVTAKSGEVAERFVFSQLDGKGTTISDFGAQLTAELIPLYDAGALYGDTPDEAFLVDVGDAVNTPTTIADGELRAILWLRMSPFAELVSVEIVKVATTDAV